ncbi:thiamine biosynthesis protein ThiF [Enterococcus casseliflavus]|uniref:ThiF family adenylyltransferase n=1 Tax=Enterococcus casseliflavus TaxID=37734 RepID=UPI001C46053D|nr:ThiF family adenylyltransferase [Enterococcus casseliflavus]MBV6375477.1 thiamine biosynthesis protein ThiF [Enterococcus casseliflavus]
MEQILKRLLDNVYKDNDNIFFGEYKSSIGKVLLLKIVCPTNFPNVLPKIFIENIDEHKLFIPHLEKNGLVCYITSNNVVYDNSNKEQIVFSSLKKAIDTIELGLRKDNNLDFRNEFIAFWDQQKKLLPVDFFANPSDKIKNVKIFYYKKKKLIVSDDNNEDIPKKFYQNQLEQTDNFDALYVPLRTNNSILPPNPHKGWSKKEVLNIIRSNVTQSKKRYFNKWIKKRNKKIKLIFLKIPISENNDVVIGFWFNRNKKSIKNQVSKPTPLLVNRLDLNYLLERTSGETYFTTYDICIVGLGSIGSKVSKELSNLGITKMTLIDHDPFEKDNLFRHELGANSLMKDPTNDKVDNLQDELETKNPYLEVIAESMNVLDLINRDPTYFTKFDYVFICVGDSMTSLALNKFFYKSNQKVFYSWVEPLGIGGHVLYIDYNQRGCFQCLYTDPENGSIISNRSSLVAPGQIIEKNLASCRTSFIPYSSITSSESSIKTAQLFYKIVTKQFSENILYTWLGDNYHFKKMGFKFSKRFECNEFPIYEERIQNKMCDYCGEHSENI